MVRYKIKYTGEQVAQWDFQNKGKSRWANTNCIVLEVPLRNLLTSIFNFLACDRIVQRAYLGALFDIHSVTCVTATVKKAVRLGQRTNKESYVSISLNKPLGT